MAWKRGIFRLSQYISLGKTIRWMAEKFYSLYSNSRPAILRNMAMTTNIHTLWPLDQESTDILQEYFIPPSHTSKFIKILKKSVEKHKVNLLNVTIRQVKKDSISLLPYAPQDMFACVLLLSQPLGRTEEEKMKRFTKDLINQTLGLKGTFYFPYRLHFSKDQLLKAYPTLHEWLRIKKKWDPHTLFSNNLYEFMRTMKH